MRKPRKPLRPLAQTGALVNVIRTTWTESREFQLPGAPAGRPFFQKETLSHAVDKLLAARDPLIQPAFQALLGEIPLNTITFDLAWEDPHRFGYLVTAANKRRAKATACWLLARNHQEFAAVVKAEHERLAELHAADPDHAAEPLGGGFVYLPDRHKRPGMGREVPCYIVRWPEKAALMAAGNPSQLAVCSPTGARLMTRPDTERVRAGLAVLLVRAYLAMKGAALNLSLLRPADFAVARDRETGARPVLLGTRARDIQMPPGKFIRRLLGAAWETPHGPCPLMPAAPEAFHEALALAAGEETAAAWIRAAFPAAGGWTGAASSGHTRDYVETLRSLMLE